jgi:hypothetical protein
MAGSVLQAVGEGAGHDGDRDEHAADMLIPRSPGRHSSRRSSRDVENGDDTVARRALTLALSKSGSEEGSHNDVVDGIEMNELRPRSRNPVHDHHPRTRSRT